MDRPHRFIGSWRVRTVVCAAVLAVPLFGGRAVAADAPPTPTSAPVSASPGDAERDLARGLVAQHKYTEAAEHYAKAVESRRDDAALWVEYGDALRSIGGRVPDSRTRALDAWEHAAALKPDDLTVLRRIAAGERFAVKFTATQRDLTRLREISATISKLDPADKTAQADGAIAALAGSLLGAERAPAKVADAVDKLTELRKDLPDDADVPYFLGMTLARQAVEAAKLPGESAQVEALLAKVTALFDDALRQRPADPAITLRYVQVLRAEQRLAQSQEREAAVKEYDKTASDLLARARAEIKPASPAYTEIFTYSADAALRQGQIDIAEKLLGELLTNKPDDQTARLAMASVLAAVPARRAEAIALLKRDITDPCEPGITAVPHPFSLDVDTALSLSRCLLDQYYTVADANGRSAIIAELQQAFGRIAARAPEHPETLKLKAKILLLPGGKAAALDAIPVIEQAVAAAKKLAPPGNAAEAVRTDWDLQYLLARCYVETRQTGEARKLLWRITQGVPNFAPARIQLADLLLESREADLAAEQIEIIRTLVPNDPAIERLQVALLMSAISPADWEKAFKALAEATPVDRKRKAIVAVKSGHTAEAKRYLELAVVDAPGDVELVDPLARGYAAVGQKQKAVDLVTAAIAASPASAASVPTLKVLLSEVRGDQPEVVQQFVLEAMNAIADPLERELKLFNFYNQRGAAEARQHLDAAERIKPEDTRVLDLRFQLALNGSAWDDAARYVEALKRMNADEAHGLIYEFRLAMAKGDLDAAGRAAGEMTTKLPQYARSWTSQGALEQARGNYAAAVKAYTAALERQTENMDAIRGLIESHDALHRTQEVKRYLDRALQLQPGDTTFLNQRIQWELVNGTTAEAVKLAMASRDTNAESIEAALRLGATYMQASQRELSGGWTASAAAYSAKARETFNDAIRRWPDNKLPYAYLADASEQAHDFPAGEAALRALAARDAFKNSAEPMVLLADYQLRAGKSTEAEAALLKAASLVPGNPAIEGRLARVYSARNDYERALNHLDANSPDMTVVRQRIETLAIAGRLPEAQTLMEKTFGAHPQDAGVNLTRTWLLLNTGQAAEAAAAAAATLKLQPGNVQAHIYAGQAALNQNPPKPADAIREFSTARDMAPTNGQIRQFLAEAYRQGADLPRAALELQNALDLSPIDRALRIRLIDLYTSMQPPRWTEAQRVIEATTGLPQLAPEPEWQRMAATIAFSRQDVPAGLDRVRETLRLAAALPADQLGRAVQARNQCLTLLRDARQFQALLDTCDDLLKHEKPETAPWFYFNFRAVADLNLRRNEQAAKDFLEAITRTEGNDGAFRTVINTLLETLGLQQTITFVSSMPMGETPKYQAAMAYLAGRGGDAARVNSYADRVLAARSKMTAEQAVLPLTMIGSALMQAGSYDTAAVAYTALLEIKPDDIEALNNLACIYGDLVKPVQLEKAVGLSQRAVDLSFKSGNPDPNLLDTHGWLLVQVGRAEEGAKLLRAAAARQPSAETYYHLGVATQKSNPTEAAAIFRKARELLATEKTSGRPHTPEVEKGIMESGK